MTTTRVQPDRLLTAEEVRSLLTTFRPSAGLPSPATVAAWRQGLAGCSFGECHAALLAFGPTRARIASPAEIVAAITTARTQRVADVIPLPRRRQTTSAPPVDYAQAGARGIEKVYAAMGWKRSPERSRALGVACPFCHAPIGRMCRPLSRDRSGRRERRDTTSLTHPSRLQRARAQYPGDHS